MPTLVNTLTGFQPVFALPKSDYHHCKSVNSAVQVDGIVVDFIHVITVNSWEILPSETWLGMRLTFTGRVLFRLLQTTKRAHLLLCSPVRVLTANL